MAHQRIRPLIDILLKRMKLWPICGVVGIRQSGKTVLLSQMVGPKINAEFVTLDSLKMRRSATRAPEAFVTQTKGERPLIIDEVQKVPDLFDALKLVVDKKRRPGSFIISGSTEFSSKSGIRESLTGRIGMSRLYPLTNSELYNNLDLSSYYIKKNKVKAQLSIQEFQKKLDRGGMPGICFLRSEHEFDETWSGWLETTCFRDMNQIMKKDHDGELALAILYELARVREPTATEVAKKLRRDTRLITRYLNAFTAIFVLHRVTSHEASVGKDHYVFADCGLASYIGASVEDIMRSHLIVEALAAYEYRGLAAPIVQHYRTSRGHKIPLILKWVRGRNSPEPLAIRFFDGEDPGKEDFAALKSFKEKIETKARILLLTQTSESYEEGSVEVYPLGG